MKSKPCWHIGDTHTAVRRPKRGVIKHFSSWITMSLVQLSPGTKSPKTATLTSEHMGPHPKLNWRNQSEDYFSPCQIEVPFSSHAPQSFVSASITDTHKCKWPPGLWGARADWRWPEEDSSATATYAPALTGAARAWGVMLVPPFLHKNFSNNYSW